MIVVAGNGRIEPKKAERILFIQLGYIGDVVVTIPVMRAVRETFPGSMLVVSVREHSRELVEDLPWVDAVLSVDKRRRPWYSTLAHELGFYRRLRTYRFDLCINVRTGTRAALMSLLSGAGCRVGHYCYRHPWTNRLYTHIVQPVAWDGIYAGEQNFNVVAPLHLDIPTRVPELHTSPRRARRVANILREVGLEDCRTMSQDGLCARRHGFHSGTRLSPEEVDTARRRRHGRDPHRGCGWDTHDHHFWAFGFPGVETPWGLPRDRQC
jgi:hypothetical protein